jgi:uncharacterized protein YihD (DUF1040 family)
MNGARDVRAEFDAYKLKETQVALQQDVSNRAKEQAFQSSLENLTDAYIKKQHELADAKSTNGKLLDGFNSTLSSKSAPDSPSARSANGSAGLESQLLGDCAVTLTKLAEEADGLEARLVALQTYVKEVIGKQ